MDASKYGIGYYPVDKKYNKWASRDHIEKPPIWCSVDMRDGNQSLVVPMNLKEKLEFYKVLLKVGFKEIEVGFPAASETEYEFLRALIDRKMIPEDVTIQVLTQCREHIIRKTFEACKGVPNAIIHFYNSTSVVQREQVFEKSKEEIKEIAVEGAKLVKKLASESEGNFRFEYSPESFTGTEPEYALEVCNAVLDVLEPSAGNNVIINLPATVEMSLPHIYASQIEFMNENLKYREYVTLSLHAHNDRGTGIADTELGILAGADRVEGTLFGNGERTGNADIVTLALNMFTHGVDPGLDLSDIEKIRYEYEKCTRMRVHERMPYSGDLVFAAFSGSHQDAIAKGMHYRVRYDYKPWNVPYIPIDPSDIGRSYEADVIRVNSQSGKGGIGYIMEKNFGFILPSDMREAFSFLCKNISDREHRELGSYEIFSIFNENYLDVKSDISIADYEFMQHGKDVKIYITFAKDGVETPVEAEGNGHLSAISNALKKYTGRSYILQVFTQHSLQGQGSQSVAASYIGLESDSGEMFWGAGTDTDVIKASANALINAFYNMTHDKYIFFSDLDDTLLTTKKEVSPKTYEALKAFTAKGNIFVICTGRGLDSALKVQKKYRLSFPNSFIAAYNGCQIYDCDRRKTIFKVGLEIQLVKEIFALADEYGVYVHTYSDEYILTSKNDEEIQDYRSKVSTPVLFCPDPAEHLDGPPCKVICIELHDHEKQERFRKAVNEKYGDILDTMYSSPYYLELIPKGYGKGTAVHELAKHLNIPIENTIAAGDAENDNSMLIEAGVGIAMRNAQESTLGAANVITETDCDHDGLVPFLERYTNTAFGKYKDV